MLAYYLHNLNPKIFEIHGYGPRWYGFSYLMGFLCAYLLVLKLSRQKILQVPREKVPDMVTLFCIFGVLLGGRLGYVLFYGPHLLVDFGRSFPYWGVLRVNEGGMSAHGGVVGTVLAVGYYAWRNKVSVINLFDASAMVAPIGLMFGRIANFINGELYGHITSVPWAVQFPTELRMAPPTPGAPTVDPARVNALIDQVYQQFPEVARQAQEYAPADQRGVAIDKIIQMVQAGNQQIADLLRPVLPARHPSQLYEALLEGLLLFVICWTVGQMWRKKGMASGAFLVFYPIMRITGEQFRVGDSPRHIFGMELSQGVLLSIPMFLLGLGYWIYFARKGQFERSTSNVKR